MLKYTIITLGIGLLAVGIYFGIYHFPTKVKKQNELHAQYDYVISKNFGSEGRKKLTVTLLYCLLIHNRTSTLQICYCYLYNELLVYF